MQHASAEFEWNDSTIAHLRSLWDEGLTTAEIGRCLGVSKNAVVGKAHRLHLPARPSPIRAGGTGQPKPARRPRCPRLADLQARTVGSPTTSPTLPTPPPVPPPRQVAPPPPPLRPPPVTPREPIRMLIRASQSCCWPIGEPGTRHFRFCDDATEAGKPYCADHCALAYAGRARRRTRLLASHGETSTSQSGVHYEAAI